MTSKQTSSRARERARALTSNRPVIELGSGPGLDFKHTSSMARDRARAVTSNRPVLGWDRARAATAN